MKEKEKLKMIERFIDSDYIHKGEETTARDYYYYTNGWQDSVDKYNKLLQERDTYKQKLDEIEKKIKQSLYIAYLEEADSINIIFWEEILQTIESESDKK